MLIRLDKYDYLLAGSGVVIDFKTPTEKQQEQQKTLGEDGFAEAGGAMFNVQCSMVSALAFFPSMKSQYPMMATCNTSAAITAIKLTKAVTPASVSASGNCCILSYMNIKKLQYGKKRYAPIRSILACTVAVLRRCGF